MSGFDRSVLTNITICSKSNLKSRHFCAAMHFNAFALCASPLKAVGSLMVLFVLAIIAATYYAVVIVSYGPALFLGGLHTLASIFIIVVLHALVSE